MTQEPTTVSVQAALDIARHLANGVDVDTDIALHQGFVMVETFDSQNSTDNQCLAGDTDQLTKYQSAYLVEAAYLAEHDVIRLVAATK